MISFSSEERPARRERIRGALRGLLRAAHRLVAVLRVAEDLLLDRDNVVQVRSSHLIEREREREWGCYKQCFREGFGDHDPSAMDDLPRVVENGSRLVGFLCESQDTALSVDMRGQEVVFRDLSICNLRE